MKGRIETLCSSCQACPFLCERPREAIDNEWAESIGSQGPRRMEKVTVKSSSHIMNSCKVPGPESGPSVSHHSDTVYPQRHLILYLKLLIYCSYLKNIHPKIAYQVLTLVTQRNGSLFSYLCQSLECGCLSTFIQQLALEGQQPQPTSNILSTKIIPSLD